jgi:hypothetical protein
VVDQANLRRKLMQMQKPTPEMIKTWKAINDEYKAKLYPNQKSAPALIEYLKMKYPVTEITDEKWKQVVLHNVLLNKCYADKLPAGKTPTAIVFSVQNTGAGNILYERQDEIFKGHGIFVGIELETAFFLVEGSSMLWDELFAFKGLDEADLNNYYLVAEYITCLKRFDMLDSMLTQTA